LPQIIQPSLNSFTDLFITEQEILDIIKNNPNQQGRRTRWNKP